MADFTAAGNSALVVGTPGRRSWWGSSPAILAPLLSLSRPDAAGLVFHLRHRQLYRGLFGKSLHPACAVGSWIQSARIAHRLAMADPRRSAHRRRCGMGCASFAGEMGLVTSGRVAGATFEWTHYVGHQTRANAAKCFYIDAHAAKQA